jgi:predicted ATPase
MNGTRTTKRQSLLSVSVDAEKAGRTLPFLSTGPAKIEFKTPLTLLVGENGCGKTTLLEAIAVRCGIRPGGGASYEQTEDERPGTAISDATSVRWSFMPIPGTFLRADRIADSRDESARTRKRLRMAVTGEWRALDEQSRGESMLSTLAAEVDASEAKLYLLDEPEAALSPERQMLLFRLLDALIRDGRSQAIVATHSPMLMAHPEAAILWMDENGIKPRKLSSVPHWNLSARLFGDTDRFITRLLAE